MRQYILHTTIVTFWRSKHSFTYYLSSVIVLWLPNMGLRFYPKCKISWKSIPWERNCPMRTDKETKWRNKTKLIFAVRNLAILPKNGHRPCHSSSIYSPICDREDQQVTSNAWAQSHVIVREVWMKQFGNGSGNLHFPCQYYSVFAPFSFIHHRRHNRIKSDRPYMTHLKMIAALKTCSSQIVGIWI